MLEWVMNGLENLLDFSNILNSSIAASWLILTVVILRFFLKKAPKWTHVALWGLVALRLLLPFSIESAFSLIPSAQTVPQEILRYEGMQRNEPAYLEVITNPMYSGGVYIQLEQTVDRVQVRMIYMTLGWLVGVFVLLVYTAICCWSLRRRVGTAVRYKGNIFQCENINSPFVLGIIKPRIYLPFKLDTQSMEYVIAHEQAHIQRKDHWWKALGFFLVTIHWFNPLIWFAFVLLCRDIELACDEKVIKKLGNEQKANYAQALVACSIGRRMITACPLAFGEIGVKERVKSIMNYKKPTIWIIVLSIIVCVVVAICFLSNPIKDADASIEAETFTYNEEMPIIDGNYYIEGFHDEMIVFQSVEAPDKKVEALIEDQTMFYRHLSESEITMLVSCSYKELQNSWKTDKIYYIIFYEDALKRRCVSILREFAEGTTGRYEYLDDTYFGQKLFKLKENEGEIELIPVEYVSIDNEQHIRELIQKGLLQEWEVNKLYETPFIAVEYHEQSRRAEKNPDTRYYIISPTGAVRCSEEEISQYFSNSNSLYRIILNDNEIECMILYDY